MQSLRAYAALYLRKEVQAETMVPDIVVVAFDGLVAQHLRASIANKQTDEQLYYWRTKSGSEVDFVVYSYHTFAAYEVKHHTKVHTTDLHSLKAFRDDYPEATVSLIYLGSDRLQIDGISILPAVEMLTFDIGH